ncbi:MAG TPA: hypothetical protein VFG81_05545 [Anaerolineales bacterium]|jgi:hypothetical protein|nr:hypothetical protein [Anaerolineales bacterium]
MPADTILYAGIELSSGRKPVTFARLDDGLNTIVLTKWDTAEVLAYLQTYENSTLVVNTPSTKTGREVYANLRKNAVQAGYKAYLETNEPKRWLETDSQDCFRVLGGYKLFPRRALEGRLQRAAILYEQGLQLLDPIDMFEEITRYKLIQGILPLENLPSSRELDALVAAYLAWMSLNRPAQIVVTGEFVLPASE